MFNVFFIFQSYILKADKPFTVHVSDQKYLSNSRTITSQSAMFLFVLAHLLRDVTSRAVCPINPVPT